MICIVWGPVSEAAAQATLSISGPADANEGDSGTRNLSYTVTLSQQISSNVFWMVCFSGTATISTDTDWSAGSDYQATNAGAPLGNNCITGGAGASYTSLTAIHTGIQVRGDTDVESDETVIATLSIIGTPPAGVTLGTSTHTHTILDDDTVALPEVTIAAGSSVTEGGDASFTVTASPSPASALTVNLTVSQSGNFASSGSTGSSKTVSVPTSGSATYPVSTVDDNTDEDNGSVTVTVNTGTGYTVGSSNSSATVTVNDNDTAGVTVSQSARTVAENGGTATYTVGLDTRPAGQVIITVTAGGAAFVDGPGGTAKPKAKDTLTFTTSNWSTAQTVTITGQNDNIVNTGGERTRTITHTIEAGHGDGRKYRPVALTTFSIPSVTVTVTDDDAPSTPEANFGASASNAAEGAGTQNIAVNLSPAPSGNVTVNYTLSGGATRGTDYSINGVSSNNGSITVGTSGTASIPVAITDDSVVEGSETVILTLGSGTGYNVGTTRATHTLTITDNDVSTPEANFAASASSAAESAGTRNVVVNLSPAPSGNVTVNYTLSGGATRGTDYSINGVSSNNGSITVGTSGTASIPVAITDDSTVESNETIILTLGSGTGYNVGTTRTRHTLTINDNDRTGTPELTITGGSAVTEGGDASFTISSNPAPSSSITVAYTVSQSGAFVASGQLGGKTRSISAASTTVAIPTEDDNLDEANGSVTVTLDNGNGYTVGNSNSATVTVNDDDDSSGGGGNPGGGNPGGGNPGGGSDPTQITLAVYPNPIYEGRRATIHAELAHTVPSVVTLPLVFTTNDAEAGDYVALATIVIDANEPFGTDWIITTKDDDMEDETFTVTFGALPAGFSRGTPASVDVIISEDANVTSIESPEGELPEAFALGQNYPNPFNPSTAIEYELPTPQHVRLEVFDATGRSVGVLVDGIRPAGTHTVRFDADNLPSGLYVYRLQANEETRTRKMTLLR